MILTFILLLFANMWAFAFQFIPVSHIPTGVTSAITTTLGWVWVVNPIVDVNTLFALFKVWIGIEFAMLGIEFFVWAYSKIPIFGKGK